MLTFAIVFIISLFVIGLLTPTPEQRQPNGVAWRPSTTPGASIAQRHREADLQLAKQVARLRIKDTDRVRRDAEVAYDLAHEDLVVAHALWLAHGAPDEGPVLKAYGRASQALRDAERELVFARNESWRYSEMICNLNARG
ncbi:hypothetical protein [Gordonia polyisoprenivorans]|uniref:hypothetical protein n=1 Tax=Gordonia polyisoprenivorans TaxID=84595 RepID=UPI001AD7DE98|nr:hypothetical protein [Gordonia polyisoprenivorans]QTI67657.1 hypothetical protein J6U32_19055 [Gordonia polyisoprenivorans]